MPSPGYWHWTVGPDLVIFAGSSVHVQCAGAGLGAQQAERDMAADTPAGTEWIAKLRSGLWAAAPRSPSSGVAPVSSSSAAGPGTPDPEQQGQQQPQQPVNERPKDMACDEATVEVLKRWLAIEKARKQSLCPKKQNVSWLLEHNRLH